MKKINLIELNEINFEIIQQYINKNPGYFQGFENFSILGVLKVHRKMSTSILNLGFNGHLYIHAKHMISIKYSD